jgi:hypothetical protein
VSVFLAGQVYLVLCLHYHFRLLLVMMRLVALVAAAGLVVWMVERWWWHRLPGRVFFYFI